LNRGIANQDNGQKYTLKTNKKGEYFSLGSAPGHYSVTLYKNADDAKANKEMFHFGKFPVSLDEKHPRLRSQEAGGGLGQGQG